MALLVRFLLVCVKKGQIQERSQWMHFAAEWFFIVATYGVKMKFDLGCHYRNTVQNHQQNQGYLGKESTTMLIY